MKVEVWMDGKFIGVGEYDEETFKENEVYRKHPAPREARFRQYGHQFSLIEVK